MLFLRSVRKLKEAMYDFVDRLGGITADFYAPFFDGEMATPKARRFYVFSRTALLGLYAKK